MPTSLVADGMSMDVASFVGASRAPVCAPILTAVSETITLSMNEPVARFGDIDELAARVARSAVACAIASLERIMPDVSTTCAATCGRPSSVGLDSERYRTANGRTALAITGASRIFCKRHGRYHVCDWTRSRVRQLHLGGGLDGSSEAAQYTRGAATGQGASPGRDGSEGTPYNRGQADIEDVPLALKRFSKKAQEYMQRILPSDVAPGSALNAMLYRAHVFMITHGAILCGERPHAQTRALPHPNPCQKHHFPSPEQTP